MSKTEELAKKADEELGDDFDIYHCYYSDALIYQLAKHLRALDASHRQLLEALEACLAKGSRWHTCDPIVTNARTAIATAKELT